jgi:hypothetical protein
MNPLKIGAIKPEMGQERFMKLKRVALFSGVELPAIIAILAGKKKEKEALKTRKKGVINHLSWSREMNTGGIEDRNTLRSRILFLPILSMSSPLGIIRAVPARLPREMIIPISNVDAFRLFR